MRAKIVRRHVQELRSCSDSAGVILSMLGSQRVAPQSQ